MFAIVVKAFECVFVRMPAHDHRLQPRRPTTYLLSPGSRLTNRRTILRSLILKHIRRLHQLRQWHGFRLFLYIQQQFTLVEVASGEIAAIYSNDARDYFSFNPQAKITQQGTVEFVCDLVEGDLQCSHSLGTVTWLYCGDTYNPPNPGPLFASIIDSTCSKMQLQAVF
jgi:hypothetical protein